MVHVSTQRVNTPVDRVQSLSILADSLQVYLDSAANQRPLVITQTTTDSLVQQIYHLSMAIKEGIPTDRDLVHPEVLLEKLECLIIAIPDVDLTPASVGYGDETPVTSVFPDLKTMAQLSPTVRWAINKKIDDAVSVAPDTDTGYRAMRARLHVLMLLLACVLIWMYRDHADIFTPIYRDRLYRLYDKVRETYLW